jgi:dihydrofolate reductase
MPGRVRVFIATSVDGFIAGPDDDLSWLPQPSGDPPPDYGYGAFIAEVGALLMGRNTYDVVAGFDGPWPYGERPMLVATHRELNPATPAVRAVAGDIDDLVARGLEAARGKDLYVDGGVMIRAALDAGLIDDLILTIVPVILGAGTPLFIGLARTDLELVGSEELDDGLVQLRYRPAQT